MLGAHRQVVIYVKIVSNAVWLMADLGFAIIDWIYDKIFNR